MGGVMKTLADTLEKELGISVESKCYETSRQYKEALNKGITLSSDRLNGVVLAENSYVNKTVTFSDFVKEHMTAVFGLFGLVILILGLMIYRLMINGKKLSAALEEEREREYAYKLNLSNSELQVKANQDQLTQIGNRHRRKRWHGAMRRSKTREETFIIS